MPDTELHRVTVYEASDGWHWRRLNRFDVIEQEDSKKGVPDYRTAVAECESLFPNDAVVVIEPPGASEPGDVIPRPN